MKRRDLFQEERLMYTQITPPTRPRTGVKVLDILFWKLNTKWIMA